MNDLESPSRERGSFIPIPKPEDCNQSDQWPLLGTQVLETEIMYFCQMIIVYIIIITSVVNLSIQNGSTELWISSLSSCIGYALPNPKLKK